MSNENKKIQQKTIDVFCARCQTDTAHTGAVDLNGELVFTCIECGGFVKVPAGMTASEIKAHFKEHKEHNVGQVSVQGSIDTLDEVMGDVSVEQEK